MAKKIDTYIPRDECVDMNVELEKSLDAIKKDILENPDVLSVGVGLKKSKGELKRELCFKITVKKKKDKDKLKKANLIPAKINGVNTDIEEVLTIQPGVDSAKYRPLIGGTQAQGSSGPGDGTMGCFGKRNSDDKIVVLSNWHVFMSNENTIDDARVGQPSHSGCCSCCSCNEIGKVVDGEFMNHDMDAAIALLDGQDGDTIPEVRFINEIKELGFVTGSAAPVPGETVYKYGRTTGLTKGQINNCITPTDTPYEFYNNVVVHRNNQCIIDPVLPYVDYFLKGDSGSVSLNEKNEVVALNYGFDIGTHVTAATDITNVMAELEFTILNSTFHDGELHSDGVTSVEGRPFSSLAMPKTVPSFAEAFHQLEAELSQYDKGRKMMNLFNQHQHEMLSLVNTDREAMAAWNRYHGPQYLAHIARSLRTQGKKHIPEYIKGISMQNLILKMTAVLQRNGSPELAKDISENYLDVLNVIGAGRTPDEWKAALIQLQSTTKS